jgi:hypothetical protein
MTVHGRLFDPKSSCVYSRPTLASHTPFLPSEDQQLIRLVSLYGSKQWTAIAAHIPLHTPKQCRERWHYHLNPSINKGTWTAEEDEILCEKHKELGNRWTEIAKFLPGRTDSSIKSRWHTVVRAQAKMQIEREKISLVLVHPIDLTTIPPLIMRPPKTNLA